MFALDPCNLFDERQQEQGSRAKQPINAASRTQPRYDTIHLKENI